MSVIRWKQNPDIVYIPAGRTKQFLQQFESLELLVIYE